MKQGKFNFQPRNLWKLLLNSQKSNKKKENNGERNENHCVQRNENDFPQEIL
jgi:hypothetical protein